MMTNLLRTEQAANFLNVSISTLGRWRVSGEGPPYSKPAKRIIYYDRDDLIEFVKSGKRNSTSDKE